MAPVTWAFTPALRKDTHSHRDSLPSHLWWMAEATAQPDSGDKMLQCCRLYTGAADDSQRFRRTAGVLPELRLLALWLSPRLQPCGKSFLAALD